MLDNYGCKNTKSIDEYRYEDDVYTKLVELNIPKNICRILVDLLEERIEIAYNSGITPEEFVENL